MATFHIISAFFLPLLAQGLVLDSLLPKVNQSNWNDLRVTWGINPFSSYNYAELPRTKVDAEAKGWVNMAPGTACGGNAHFKGLRYWKNSDLAAILVFDANGYIAGIQAGFPTNAPNNNNQYPQSQLRNHPFVLDGNNYFITAYFVDPATICTGRSAAQYTSQGTGTGLWIQNGTDPVTNSQKIPAKQADIDKTMWTKGVCFVSMGLHYWYNVRKDMDCNEFFPVFLLYNDGVLNAFGWAFGLNIQTSSRFEHPPQTIYNRFLNPVPTCLSTWGTLTTMHIYLTEHYLLDTC